MLRFLFLCLVSLAMCFGVSTATAQVANFSFSPKSGCAPLAVSFTSQSTGTISTYSWDLGNSVTSPNATASTTYSSPGTYIVTLTVTGPGGSSTKTDTVQVYPPPTVSFSASPLASCAMEPTQFSSSVSANAPGPLRYSWAFGDGGTDTTANPLHTYTTAGTYTVSLTVTNGAQCLATVVRNAYVTAWQLPKLSFSVSQSQHCGAPATVNFASAVTGGVGPFTYLWDFGDQGSAGTANPAHTYTGGSYSVQAIVTDARGCKDTERVPNYIFVLGTLPSFTGGDMCVDSTGPFVNTTGAGDTATWDFGDGTLDTGNYRWHKFLAAGTFNVRMSVRIGNCVKTATKTITIHPKAVLTITQTPPLPCPAPQTLAFTVASTPTATYNWTWQSGGTATGTSATKTYANNAEDRVRITATTAQGCVSAGEAPIYVHNIIQKVRTYDRNGELLDSVQGGCAPYRVQFGDIELFSSFPSGSLPQDRVYPGTIVSIDWDFGDGGTATGSRPIHTFTTTGRLIVRTIVTTSNGCKDTAYTPINIYPNLPLSFTVSKDSICNSETVIFTNTTAMPPNATLKWFGGGLFPTKTGNLNPNQYEFYLNNDQPVFVTLKVYREGCEDSLTRKTPIIVKGPFITAYDSMECLPSLRNNYYASTIRADSVLWYFGDGKFASGESVVHTYDTQGNWKVLAIAYNFTTGCIDSSGFEVPMYDPAIDFEAPIRRACVGRSLEFQSILPAPQKDRRFAYPSDIRWVTDGDTSLWYPGGDLTNPSWLSWSRGGVFDVTMLLRYGQNGVCYDSVIKPAYVEIPHPLVSFNADITQGCNPLHVTFRDSSSNAVPGFPGMQWTWSFGARDTAYSDMTQDTIRYSYDTAGRFSVKLIVMDSLRCVDSLERIQYISVHKTIARVDSAAKGFGPDSACLYEPIAFRAASTGLTRLAHHWDFGDGTTDTGVAPVHRYTSRGRFRVRLLSVDSIGCMDSIVRHVPINISKPDAAFNVGNSVSICPPLQVSVTNSTTGATGWLWDFGDGNTGPIVIENPVTTYTQAGIYRISLVASDPAGCRDTAYDSVRVLGYNGAFSFTPATGCVPLQVSFSPTVGNIPKLTWDFGDGFTDTSSNAGLVTHEYARPGAYMPKVIFSDGQGCNATSQALDSVYVDALRADFNWSLPCADTPFTLTSTATAIYGAPTTFTWTAPAATAPAQGSPARMRIPAAGTFPVTLVAANAAGCTDTITKDVPINALPPVSAGPDTAVCPGDTAHLFASGALSFVWAPAATNPTAPLSCTSCPAPLAWTRTPVVYTLSGVDANGCWGRDSVRVAIQLKTTSTTGPGGAVCYGESYRLNAAGADTYAWSPAQSLDSPGIAAPLATPTTTTTYMVISQEGSCQVDTQRIEVVVHARPDFSAGPDKIIALGAAATLEPRGSFAAIEWLYGDTTLSCLDCRNPNAHPSYTRTYWARAVSAQGCESIDSVTVHVRCNGSQVFIPNTFTPNGDGQNDWFYAQGAGLDRLATFRVFNRWGELVFEALNVPLNSATAGWDGTYKGQALPPDTYVYTMTSRCRSGETVSFKGDVSLVR